MPNRRQALSFAKQYRRCPPVALFESGAYRNEVERHLSMCPYCENNLLQERDAWRHLTERLRETIPAPPSAATDEPVKPGQFRFIKSSRAAWRENFYYNPPLILVLECIEGLAGGLLVAQVYDDVTLAGPGDLILDAEQSGLGELFVESWNLYTLSANDLGAPLGAVTPEIVAAVSRMADDPQWSPEWSMLTLPLKAHDPRHYFRELEIEVGYTFAAMATQQLLDQGLLTHEKLEAQPTALMQRNILNLNPAVFWPDEPSNAIDAILTARFNPSAVPLAAKSSDSPTLVCKQVNRSGEVMIADLPAFCIGLWRMSNVGMI